MSDYFVRKLSERDSQGNLIKFTITTTLEEIETYLYVLKTQLTKNEAEFTVLEDNCYELISRLPLPVYYYDSSFIIRARPNFYGEVFTKTSQIGYNPLTDQIELGRFNLKGESVFYGAIPISSHSLDGVMTSICETYKDLFNREADFIRLYLTIGRWQVVKPIPLVLLTFWDKLWNNEQVKNINPVFINHLELSCSEIDQKKCQLFYQFISEKAGRLSDNNNNYLLTTAFYHALKRYYGNETGILYSSSMTENQGLSVALSKEIIDSDFLKLDLVVMYKCERNPADSKKYFVGPCSQASSIDDEGNFRLLGIC
jgi:hypothetical protein